MNNTLKTGGTISIDSAIWSLEALITYDEAFPDSASKDFKLLEAEFIIAVDQNNMVLESDVQQLYDDMLDTITAQLAGFSEEVKFLAFSDVALVGVENGTATLRSNNGYGFNLILGIYETFDEDDDWYWGTLSEIYGDPPLGKCDGSEYGVSDGSNELQYRLNHPVTISIGTSFTDIVTLVMDGSDYIDNDGNARLFWGWDYPNDECLTNDTLTYYLIQSHNIINSYNNNGGLRPIDKDFIRVEILDEQFGQSGQTWHLHRYFVTYGKPFTNPN